MVVPPLIFDRKAVSRHRTRAGGITDATSVLLARNRDQLLDRLLDVKRTFSCALSLGCRSGLTAEHLKTERGIATVIAADYAESFARQARNAGHVSVACDEEWIPFWTDAFDLIIAEHTLHWTNDLPGALIQLRRCLRPDGLFLASLFGGSTLHELRDAFISAESDLLGGVTPRVSPFVDVRDAGDLLMRAGLALPVADTDIIEMEYENLNALMSDLRLMGETNAVKDRHPGLSTPRLFAAVEQVYRQQHATKNGHLKASFEIVMLTGWAPSETQQKALIPGSAKGRLADALGAEESKL